MNEKTKADELQLAIIDAISHFKYHNKNLTKKQEELIYELERSFYGFLKSDEYKSMVGARVVVEVRGGLVSAVYADKKEVSVDVLDYDNYRDSMASDEEREYYESLEQNVKKMEVVY